MSKFTIYSPDNTPLYTGTPTYTGSYRKPGMLEFRDVSVPEYIDFAPGCYVGYESGGSIVPEYSRTGYAYKIYTVPQVKKQARSGSYGAAFVYQSVQLFDASKDLEYCPFRDLVKGDNRIHFSTQPSISTFESLSGATGVEAGLAARFQACLEDMYGAGSWVVRTATVADGASSTLLSLMADAREFTVSGVNLLEALDKVFDIWPEVGWVYRLEQNPVTHDWVNTIVIGGAGLDANSGTYRYGKGNGLKSLTRTVANADELANRIFAYGSQRNMTSDWYRSQSIKDSESVDIQHLMIPVNTWGETNGEPDAAKAYVEDGGSIDRRGLRLRTAYFDGTEDLPEIYPTIEGMTIRDVLGAGPDYIPNITTIWRDQSERVDMVYRAERFEDDGYSGSSGQSRLKSLHFDVNEVVAGATVASSSEEYYFPVFERTIDGRGLAVEIEAVVDFTGTITVANASRVWTRLEVTTGTGDDFKVWAEAEIAGTETESGSGVWNVKGGQISLGGTTFLLNEAVTISAKVYAALAPLEAITPDDPFEEPLISDDEEEPVVPEYREISISTQKGSGHIYETTYRSKTFRITLRQIGFDIAAQGDLGDGKVISMRSGQCQGRSFAIKDAILDIEHDTWELECYRSEDESLGQWFPNAIYPVRGAEQNYPGDEFVLLDIAMPDSYIRVAENKLYNAALSLLSDTATERWQYTPEIDAKFMVENSRTIRPAENMTIVGVDIVEGDAGFVYLTESAGANLQTTDGEDLILDESGYEISVLVDTVVISEGESAIPTYKVTLLDRKRKVFTESKSVSEYTARSVANAKQVETSRITSESSFFELCDDGSVKLKVKYIGLWADGWMAAGGVQSDGEGGGGGGGSYVLPIASASVLGGIKVGNGLSINSEGVLSVTGGGGTNVSWGTKVPDYSRVLTVAGTSETVLLDGALDPLTAAVNAIDWFTVVTVDDEPTLRLNPRYAGMWADGWVAAGGVGSSGGGGGGAGFLYQLGDVSIPNPPNEPNNGDLLVYNTTTHRWENKPQSSIVPDLTTVNNRLTALEGSVTTINGQITALQAAIDAIDWFIPTTVTIDGVSTSTLKLNPIYAGVWAEGWVSAGGVGSSGGGGGSTVSVQNLADTTAQESRIAKITVDGIETYLYNDVAWGTYSQSDKTIGLTINGTTRTICLDGYAGGSSTLAGLDDVSVGLATSTDLLTYTGGVWVPLSRSSLLSGYIPLSGSTAITGTLGASGWSITKGGVAEFNTIQGKGSSSLYIGHSDDSIDGFIYIQEDTYLKNEAIMGGTSNSASENKWIIEPDGSAEFTSVVIIDGTTKEPLEGFLKADGTLDTTEYVTIETTQTITGTKTFTATNLYAKNFLPSSGSSYNLGSTSARWATLYAVDANLTGDLTMSANKHIDIGPLRIEYDSNAKALHITKASSSDTQNYGIYADGFVAAGGIQS